MSGLTSLRDATYTMVNGAGTVLGTCFRAPVLDSSGTGTYLLTAGHAVLEEFRRHAPVRIVGATDDCHEGDVRACGTGAEPDVGLLHVGEPLGEPLACAARHPGGPVLVRGSPSGLATSQATLRGWNAGPENLGSQRFIDVIVDDMGFLEPASRSPHPVSSLGYSTLSGLSGAPVCDASRADETPVLGIVARRNTAGITNHVYAVPILVAAVFLGTHGHFLQTSRAQAPDNTSTGILTGRLMGRLMRVPGGMHQLWEDTSELFYAGVPVDVMLEAALNKPVRHGLETPLQTAGVRFLLARLMMKRGRSAQGLTLLRQARSTLRHAKTAEHHRLAALIDLRMLMHSAPTSNLAHRRAAFESGVGRYEDAPGLTDADRAYEVASALGSEAAEWVNLTAFGDDNPFARHYFRRLLGRHGDLLDDRPDVLIDKQEIVHISLNTMDALWDTVGVRHDEDQSARLATLALRGRMAATQRQNAIFQAQMMVTEAIAARIVADDGRAFALLGLVGAALASANLDLSQEGIRSYLSYLDRTDPLSAQVLKVVHSLGAHDGRVVLLGSNLDASSTERSAITVALKHCEPIEHGMDGIAGLFDLPAESSSP